ncbi:MAG: 2-oxoacid:acceptor oxidoreductase subunit alpha [Halobacteriovoraceae bacterium]|jgi:2-oxoglutarate/2-oxoacid ferredoxin oxidoreductase subunit alpha|nr:2-oxoacid:acceptor oxidoreductase subunit alpha [Halobacteriovoraceae bacterium]
MNSTEIDYVTIRFSGDSGDGMQLTGTQFSNTSAMMGNDLSTFPDFPAEIRAPQGTIAGISGFQVNFGAVDIFTHGDEPHALVAMNPAALKANLADIKLGGTIIVNNDAFTELNLKKAGYTSDPLESDEMTKYKLVKANLTSQTIEALKDIDIDKKSKSRCKNFYALGMTYFIYTRDMKPTLKWIEQKFAKYPDLVKANSIALKTGYNFAETIEVINEPYIIKPAAIEPGTYRQINGNTATAWGLMCAAEKAELELFLGSYPITPATDILHELAKFKHLGVKTFQAEDEIAGICSAIGASFSGDLGLTTSSGPGIALKGEALNLAIMLEIPLVVVNVQRGGPSTGLPTKTEQSDLLQALGGRNGDSPMIIVAAKSPSDSFHMAYEAARLSIEHMTPCMLLTDGYIANGSEPWKLPNTDTDYRKIKVQRASESEIVDGKYLPYLRDAKTLVRKWAIPGMKGFEHRVGGLEKQVDTGNVCYEPANHETMTHIRRDKVQNVQNNIPKQEVNGKESGDILLITWGGTYGACHSAMHTLIAEGKNVSHMHISYINPMPSNVGTIINGFKKVIVAELNCGQMKDVINARFNCNASGYNKVQGLPFKIAEIKGMINRELEQL